MARALYVARTLGRALDFYGGGWLRAEMYGEGALNAGDFSWGTKKSALKVLRYGLSR